MFLRRGFCDRHRQQPTATVDNEVAVAVPMATSAKVVTFGGFKRGVASFHMAGVILCDIPTCFLTCRKSFCVAGTRLLHHFQKMHCIFHCKRSTLETSIVMLRGRRSTSDVLCCLFFCESHCHGCAKWLQGATFVACVAFCDMR